MTKKVLLPAIIAVAALSASSASAADTSIQLHFAGSERVAQNGNGGLDIFRADGSVQHYRPRVYQVVDGRRTVVLPAYHVVSRDRVELEVHHVDPAAQILVANATK
jgi:hypothetical protein